MEWAMRFTFHSGYEPPNLRPQFLETVGSDDPAAQVLHAAKLGVAGIMYPWALDRSPEEVVRVGTALRETGLACSCILSAPSSILYEPLWTDRSIAGRKKLETAILASCKVATSLGSSVLAALVMADPGPESADAKKDAAVANLDDMAMLAGDHGIAIGIEPMSLPFLMLQLVSPTLEIIRRAGRSNVGLIYDTGHVAAGEGALMPVFDEAFDHIVLLQLADVPGRVEPGAGTLDLVTLAAEALRRGYSGLVDLEHGWSDLSGPGEQRGLDRLRAFDADVRAAVGGDRGAASRQPLV